MSDELFRALTDRPPTVDHGQRAAQRVPVTMQAAVVLLSEEAERTQLQAQILDVSPIGVGMVLSQSLAKGDLFAVRLRTLTDEPFWLVCKTARSVPRPDHTFLIGAHFVRVLQLKTGAGLDPNVAESDPMLLDTATRPF